MSEKPTATHPHAPESPSPGVSTRHSYTSTLHGREDDDVPPLPAALERELTREESRISQFGGNDPEPPAPKTPVVAAPAAPANPAALLGQPPADPNMVTWDGPADPANPQNWSRGRKWVITASILVLSIGVTFASSGPSTTIIDMQRDFNVSKEASYMVTASFLLGYAFGPMFWGPGSELLGRQPVMIGCMICYTLFILGQALAQNYQTLIVTRFISGVFAVAPMSNSGGVIADIWDPATRGLAMNMWSAACFVGPALGPVVCSFIVQSHAGWRWVYWVTMMFAGSCTFLGFLTLPETYAPVLLARKAKRLRKEDPTGNAKLYAAAERQDWSLRAVLDRSVYRPFIMLGKEPILLLVTAYTSFVYALLFAMLQALPVIFIRRRHFDLGHGGLMFIAVGLGAAIGSVLCHLTMLHYPRLIKQWRGFPPPEERLYGAMIGGPLFVIAIFWMGWTGEYESVPWYVPGLAIVLVGCGMNMIFVSFVAYLVDVYLMYSASAFAANAIARSLLAGVFPLFTTQMFVNMGVQWASTLIALIALLLAPSPFLFYKYGARIRQKSVYAPCIDLKIAKALEAEGVLDTKKKKEKSLV